MLNEITVPTLVSIRGDSNSNSGEILSEEFCSKFIISDHEMVIIEKQTRINNKLLPFLFVDIQNIPFFKSQLNQYGFDSC